MRLIALFVFSLFFAANAAYAACPIEDRAIIVGAPPADPFVMTDGSGATIGFDVDLLASVLDRVGCANVTYVPLELSERLDALSSGRVDIVIGGMSMTADRERAVDFSHAYYKSGQAFLAPEPTGLELSNFWEFTVNLWDRSLKTIFLFFMLPFLFGTANLLWFVEQVRRRVHASDKDASNDIVFSEKYLKGVFEAIYFVNTTMTTVGYGDFTVKTFIGRFLTMPIQWTGAIIGSLFMGSIIQFASFDAAKYNTISAETFRGESVAVVANTTGEDAARGKGFRAVPTQTLRAALDLLANGKEKAVLFDEPNLRYLVANGMAPGMAVSAPITTEYYAFAFPTGSPLREPVDVALLDLFASGQQEEIRNRYFGE